MTGRIKIIRKVSSVVDGRRQQEETEFYSCDIVNIGLHFFHKDVRLYAASCSEV